MLLQGKGTWRIKKKRGMEKRVCFQSLLKENVSKHWLFRESSCNLLEQWQAQQSWADGEGLEPGIRTEH